MSNDKPIYLLENVVFQAKNGDAYFLYTYKNKDHLYSTFSLRFRFRNDKSSAFCILKIIRNTRFPTFLICCQICMRCSNNVAYKLQLM